MESSQSESDRPLAFRECQISISPVQSRHVRRIPHRSPPVTQDANKRRRRRFHSSTDESFVMHRDRIGATYSRRPILKRDNAEGSRQVHWQAMGHLL